MRRATRGYTIIEVMMALAILAVGATGVIALQKVALIGNSNARIGDGARQVASTWAERLKVDALQWNDPLGIPDIGETRWLATSVVYDPVNPPGPGQWILAPEVPGWSSPVADIHGADVAIGDTTTNGVFCTHLQMARAVQKPLSLVGATHPIAVRGLVRVIWRRDLAPITECRTTAPASIEDNDARYGFYYLSTVIGQEEASN
ncbi:type IV pilus modification PilV family protein [Polyangium mundeleinium]|uniref:Prepilin-type N-terminal cleavage/methylation domain-containing protein n=1 Tax=Polyangium mundeleinium TaxID=2995306 RepID=A0ABT5EZI5_9BACT|nr:prepilin-type N-terminal cleavage/methylation domain-containing protein [Polyangium mundeleinium]MDC0747259.1 prepilin-type N-terminal cleavage/methylation domain-containing protein [Polyangium mundeleinium]